MKKTLRIGIIALIIFSNVPSFSSKFMKQDENLLGVFPREVQKHIMQKTDLDVLRFGVGFTTKDLRALSREARIDLLAKKRIRQGVYKVPLEILKNLVSKEMVNKDLNQQITEEEYIEKLKRFYKYHFLSHSNLLFSSKYFMNLLLQPLFPVALYWYGLSNDARKILLKQLNFLDEQDEGQKKVKNDLFLKLWVVGSAVEMDLEELTVYTKDETLDHKTKEDIKNLPNNLNNAGFYQKMALFNQKYNFQGISTMLTHLYDLAENGIVFNEVEYFDDLDDYKKKILDLGTDVVPNIISIPLELDKGEGMSFVLIQKGKMVDYEKLLSKLVADGKKVKIILREKWHNEDEDITNIDDTIFTNIVNESNKYQNQYNIVDQFNTPLLSEALNRKMIDLVQSLLGANPWWNRDLLGNNPLHIMAMGDVALEKNKEFLSILENVVRMAGPLINQKNNRGMTPLLLAVESGLYEIVNILLANGADPNKADDSDKTPLLAAWYNNNIEIAKILLESQSNNKVNVNVIVPYDENGTRLFNGDSLLIAAVRDTIVDKEEIEWVKLLVQHKADINYQNINKESALSIAYEQHNQELLLTLTEY